MHLIYDLPGDIQGVIFKKVFEMEVLNQLRKIHKKIEFQDVETKTEDHGNNNYSLCFSGWVFGGVKYLRKMKYEFPKIKI